MESAYADISVLMASAMPPHTTVLIIIAESCASGAVGRLRIRQASLPVVVRRKKYSGIISGIR